MTSTLSLLLLAGGTKRSRLAVVAGKGLDRLTLAWVNVALFSLIVERRLRYLRLTSIIVLGRSSTTKDLVVLILKVDRRFCILLITLGLVIMRRRVRLNGIYILGLA